MNELDQIIAIAEACGWKWHSISDFLGTKEWGWSAPNCLHSDDYYKSEKSRAASVSLPKYTTDLNAMHEAEKTLSLGQRDQYINHLLHICDRAHRMASVPGWLMPTATARQRAEAFLITCSLWTT